MAKIRTKAMLGYEYKGNIHTRLERAPIIYNYQGYSFRYPRNYDSIWLLLKTHRSDRYYHRYFTSNGEEVKHKYRIPDENWSNPVYEVIKDRKQDLFLVAYYQIFMASQVIHMYKDMGRNREGYIGRASNWPHSLNQIEQAFVSSIMESN